MGAVGAAVVADRAEVGGIDECAGVTADELVRAIAENLIETWAEADEIALTVDDEDQVERALEDAPVDRVFGIE